MRPVESCLALCLFSVWPVSRATDALAADQQRTHTPAGPHAVSYTTAQRIVPESAEPPIGPTLTNPGFEHESAFTGWQRPGPPLFRTGISSVARSGRKSAMVADDLGLTWGLFQQRVPIPQGVYNVRAWVRVDGGYAFLWVERMDGRGKVLGSKRDYVPVSHRLNPLVPDFVHPDHVVGDDSWQPLEVSIDVEPPTEYLNLKFGSYFMPGRMYFDDVTVEEAKE